VMFSKHIENIPINAPLLYKYQTITKSTFHNFCNSVGHEDKDYRTLEIIKETNADTYRVQFEHVIE
jgi:hypothetical protein